jgi:hypothetical protein
MAITKWSIPDVMAINEMVDSELGAAVTLLPLRGRPRT